MANKYYSFINDSTNTIKTSLEGINQLNLDLLVKEVHVPIETCLIFNQALALLSQQKYNETIDTFDKMSQTKNKELFLLSKCYTIEAYLALNQKEKAEKVFINWFSNENDSSIKTISFILLKLEDNDLEFAFKMAKSLDTNSFESNFTLAKISYRILANNKQDLFLNENINDIFMSSILKSIRINPFRYESIQLFGYYYGNIIKDTKKALKCYQKSYELCKDLNICGLELVDCLINENMHDLAVNILRKAINEIPYCKWAQLRLGLINLKNANYNEAIRLFYAVIRYNAEDL
jgi:tetratricopeptide (TPR) repeat protein